MLTLNELPVSYQEDFTPYRCPFYDNWLIMSDIHVPYHDNGALSELLNYAIGKGVKAILINGDLMDCYSLSKFEPDPRKRNMKEEIEATKELLDTLHKYTGAKIFYKIANHEERLEKILIVKAPQFLNMKEFEIDFLLNLHERNIEFIKDQRIVYIGKLAVLHGHEIGLHSAIVNPARSLFLKTKKSAMCGHLHIPSQHTAKAVDDTIISTWSTGHLGDPHPKYRRINDWVHGGARIEVGPDGSFEVINLRIINNKLFRS